MGEKKTIEVLISGGQATGGPPIGPSLGPLGVNVFAVVSKINELTKDFAGIKVPVMIIVDVETKEFEVKVGVPTTAALIISELKASKGSGEPKSKKVGNLSMEQVLKIAKTKSSKLLAKTLKAAVKEVLGSCISVGVTINGKDPKIVQKEVDEGMYDEFFIEKPT